ncbi:hypothetical protein ACFV0R_31610 [Streptomyces sp. NPDC059578]|uniref:hypothetical protein n=1 Tax=Streptomyces sp. NPDC059578 TaxID=3346874 RepID=UPI0036914E38
MTTAQRLTAIDWLCSREPAAGHPGAVSDGPAHPLIDLTPPVAQGAAGPGDAEEQLYAERDALARSLTARHGEPDFIGLQGVFLRSTDPGEAVPEPWRSLSSRAGDALVWWTSARWLVLAITREGPEIPPRLLAAVTAVDPP